uniref:Uncharacterized protein AlNc14C242G9494 n=1 Tax=Albugo laibachii Nc14 TaxID=890382 RepID=F0WT04_9STRA|nr:conserved hypothetical protein [Albugo laibachii Nc14]|eukprot:CCA24489.1 conserved hypothetical protein [Albugo laibachii Nc14]
MSLIRVGISFALALALSIHGLKKHSLNKSGAIAAFFVGWLTMSAGYFFGTILLAFYFSGSKLTKLKEKAKKSLDENHKPGGRRDALQVLASSFIGSFLALVWFVRELQQKSFLTIGQDRTTTFLLASYLGNYACCTADTWASELGVLSTSDPILVTTLKRVPAGTNGGITFLGIFASIAGGGFIGMIHYFFTYFTCPYPQAALIPFSMLMGLFGSLIDSLLGATIQTTYYNQNLRQICAASSQNAHQHIAGRNICSNEAVNFLSALMTAITSGILALYVF